jgi:hypothetical protein
MSRDLTRPVLSRPVLSRPVLSRPVLSRRSALRAGVAGLVALAARPSWALGPGSQLDVAEIMLSSGTLSRPTAWQRMLYEVIHTTSVEANPVTVQVAPDDPALFAHPFSVMVGDAAFPELSESAVEQLRRYLSYGGFLLVDDASGLLDGPFTRSVRRLCSRLFPTRPLSPLPGDHSVYRSFFLLERPLGRVAVSDVLEGVAKGPVTPLIFCPNDLSGALERSGDGRDRFPVVPGGSEQRREATKLGVNLVMYSLTSNYKHDQAHVAELMREGRLE